MKKVTALILALAMLLGICSFAQAEGEVIEIRVWSDNAHEKELRNKQVEEFNNTIGKENNECRRSEKQRQNCWSI